MRRQYNRLPAAQFTVPRVQIRRPVQNRGRGRGVRNTFVNAVDTAIGGSLAERPVNIRREIEEKRRELQEKYRQEAAEAEQKRIRREQKKREQWLKRQESLVKPGFRLGCGKPSPNLQRDLEEHQNAIGYERQEDSPYQQQSDQQLRMLLQQKADRDLERDQLDTEIARQDQEAYRKIIELRRQLLAPRSRNIPRDLAASTSNTASPSTSKTGGSENSKKPANVSGVDQYALPSTSNINGSENTRKPPNFLGVAQNASPSTSNISARRPAADSAPTSIFNTDGPANTKKPVNFLGTAQKTSLSTSILSVNPANTKKPVNFLGAAQKTSSSTSNLSVNPANTKKPVNFLGAAQKTSSSTSNLSVNPANTKKPANFLGAAQIASPSTSNTNNDARQQMSGRILGSGDNVSIYSAQSPGQTEVDYRERMLAARLRMQAQYNEEVKKAEQAKDQEEHNLAEDVGKLCLK